MRRIVAAVLLLSSCSHVAPVAAQSRVQTPGGTAPGTSVGYGAKDGAWTPVTTATPLPTGGKQESFVLVASNTPASPVTAYGGTYVFSQACSAYGTLSLRYRGPDGATMMAMLSKTAADTAGGTMIALGTNAVIDATVSGTTACNATLTRIPQ